MSYYKVVWNVAYDAFHFPDLILYHTILTLNDPKEEKEKMLVSSIFSFFSPLCFLLFQRKIVIVTTFYLLSANAFNLVMPKMFPFGQQLMVVEKENCSGFFSKRQSCIIPTTQCQFLTTLKEKAFENIVGNGGNVSNNHLLLSLNIFHLIKGKAV